MTPGSGAGPGLGRPLVGVALVLAAVLAFAVSDVLTKHLAERHPVPVVMAMRYGVSLLLLLGLVWPRIGSTLWRTRRTGPVVLRGLVLAVASLTMGYALRLMPVGETVAIIYLAPFAVLLLSASVLGERVGPAAWLGAGVGFAGVLLILRPGGGLDPLGVAFAVTNACCATVYFLMTRALARTETTMALLFHVTLDGSVLFLVLALPFLPGLQIGAADLGLMLALGAVSTLGHFLFTSAYREAPPSLLAPVNYVHLVWAVGLGWVVFAHVPDALTLAGMGLVVAAGVGTALRAHMGRPPVPPPVPPVP
jgi:drug/metabolite transporter (DMT)-like permease